MRNLFVALVLLLNTVIRSYHGSLLIWNLASFIPHPAFMNCNRTWNVMSWNVRGINSEWKWDPIKNKIANSLCDIICLQETKRDSFDALFLKKFCPQYIDDFVFLPSNGNSGGILVAWNSNLFEGELIFFNGFATSVQFWSKHDGTSWIVTCVYGPCTPNGKNAFLD